MARLGLAVLSLVLALGAAELAARLLLPPAQVVEVDPVATAEVPETVVEREQEGGINVLIDWSGHHGVRLFPRVRATIRNHTLSGRTVVIETNDLGLRHPELAPGDHGEHRILVLGDSITFGDYVDREETYPTRLERMLGEAGRRVEVVNAGLPGASTRDEFYLYHEVRDAVEPDAVLLAMYLNDAQSSDTFVARALPRPWSSSRLLAWSADRLQGLRTRLLREHRAPGVDPTWAEEFRAGRALGTGEWRLDQDAFDFEIYNARNDFGLAWSEQSWAALEPIVELLARDTAARGERFGVVLFPVRLQVESELEELRPQRSFALLCRRLDLPCLDLFPALRASFRERPRALYYDHCHLNPDGNEVVASALARWLPEAGLAPRH